MGERIAALAAFLVACSSPPTELVDSAPAPPDAAPDAGPCSPSRARLCSGEWCIERPSPIGAPTFTGVAAVDRDDVWAVGGRGAVVRWNGVEWRLVESGTTRYLGDAHVTAAGEAWMVGQGATVFRSDGCHVTATPVVWGDSYGTVWSSAPDDIWLGWSGGLLRGDGTHWSAMDTMGSGVNAISGRAADDVWISTGQEIWHWDGGAFSPATLPPEVSSISDVWAASPSDVFFVTSGQLFGPSGAVYHGDGRDWTVGPSGNWNAVWGSSADDVWVVARSSMAHWDGSSWTDWPGIGGYGIAGTAADDVWVPGQNHVRHWDGMTWEPGESEDESEEIADLSAAGGVVWAVTRYRIARRLDGRWSSVPHPPTAYPSAVWAAGPHDVWFGGESNEAGRGTLLHWDGVEVTEPTPDGLPRITDVSGCATNDVWAVGLGVDAWHWDGLEWSAVAPPPFTTSPTTRASVWCVGPDDVWVSGAAYPEGWMLHWNGDAWTLDGPNGGTSPGLVFGSGPNDLWASLTFANGLYHRVAGEWLRVRDEAGFGWSGAPDDVWFVHDQTKISHFDGSAWETEELFPIDGPDDPFFDPGSLWVGAIVGNATDLFIGGRPYGALLRRPR